MDVIRAQPKLRFFFFFFGKWVEQEDISFSWLISTTVLLFCYCFLLWIQLDETDLAACLCWHFTKCTISSSYYEKSLFSMLVGIWTLRTVV